MSDARPYRGLQPWSFIEALGRAAVARDRRFTFVEADGRVSTWWPTWARAPW